MKGIQSQQSFCATILECTVNHLNILRQDQPYYYGKIDPKNEMIYNKCLWCERWPAWDYFGVELAQSIFCILGTQITPFYDVSTHC